MQTKPRFPQLTVDPDNTALARVSAPIAYYDDRLPWGALHIPTGKRTDGASIPRPFRWLVGQPFSPKYWRASLIHDVMYAYNKGTQKDADDIFKEILLEDGVSKFTAYIMWGTLRCFGWIWWKA